MNAIPAGVEAALLEAGFSITEIAILRRLVVDNACTLRELAGRTGKSTGVLDQAVKKLLQKCIVKKETINAATKYSMTSLDAVLQWMEADDRRKREHMARRQQNFETFLRTIEQDKKRPEIEYFEGIENFPKAYRKLLGCGVEMLRYEPVFCSVEEHPLYDFMTEWIRIRRKHGVSSRVIAHNTPLGRRFQSRDPYEHRRTVLIEEGEYPFTFEKILCGDTLACFNYAEHRACLLKYPELVSMERSMFEALWRQCMAKQPPPLPMPPSPFASVPRSVSARPSRDGSSIRSEEGSAIIAEDRYRSGFFSRKFVATLAGIVTTVILLVTGWGVLR